jgi:hypothetical protein
MLVGLIFSAVQGFKGREFVVYKGIYIIHRHLLERISLGTVFMSFRGRSDSCVKGHSFR